MCSFPYRLTLIWLDRTFSLTWNYLAVNQLSLAHSWERKWWSDSTYVDKKTVGTSRNWAISCAYEVMRPQWGVESFLDIENAMYSKCEELHPRRIPDFLFAGDCRTAAILLEEYTASGSYRLWAKREDHSTSDALPTIDMHQSYCHCAATKESAILSSKSVAAT